MQIAFYRGRVRLKGSQLVASRLPAALGVGLL